MKTKVKAFIAVVGALAVVTAISLIISSRGPLYGKADNDNWVPDLIGTWTGEVEGYVFDDVAHPNSQPEWFAGPFDRDIVITDQIGRTFAGAFGPVGEGDRFKLTGVMLPDRTVSIQYFEPSEERHFITGRMTRSGGTLQISGYMHFFDDFNHRHFDPPHIGQRMMASGYVQVIKVD